MPERVHIPEATRQVDINDATPRPWKRSCFLIQGPNGDWVTHTGMGNLPPSRSHESEANAALIVTAVNAHSALVEALRDLANATDAFMEAAEKGEHVKAQTQFPVGESLVWTLKDKVIAARAALAETEPKGK